jgi:hypothetical protein
LKGKTTMIKHRDSHVDHGLTEAQLDYLLDRFADRDGFFIETITLPRALGTVPCGLYGPKMGDPPIGEHEVRHAARGDRAWPSRLVDLPPRDQRELTVIAGPHEETCTTCKAELIHLGVDVADGGVVGCDHCNSTGKLQYVCILYTAFGGPVTPQEPGDPGCKDVDAATKFWADHALAAPK